MEASMEKHLKLCALLSLLLCLGTTLCEAGEDEIRELLDPLSSAAGWTVGGDNRGPATAIEAAADPAAAGDTVAALNYDFLGVATGYNNCQYIKRIDLDEEAELLILNVYGDGSGHALRLRLVDSTGKYLQYTFATLNWLGWREVSVNLRAPDTSWGGDGERLPTGPCYFHGFLLESKARSFVGTGRIYVRDLRQGFIKQPTALQEGFETDELGWLVQTTAGSGQASIIADIVYSGSRSLRIEYQDLPSGGALTIAPKHSILLSDIPLEFSVYACGAFQRGCFLLADSLGKEFRLPIGRSVSGQWLNLSGSWEEAAGVETDQTMNLPLFFRGLLVYPAAGGGQIYLDSLVCDAVQMQLQGGVFFTTESVKAQYAFSAVKPQTLDIVLELWRTQPYRELKRTVSVGEPVTGGWDLGALSAGLYRVRALLKRGELQLTGPAADVMVSEPQEPVLLRKPYTGVQTHYAHGKGKLPDNVQLAARAGVQMIRDEVYWGTIEKAKGEFKFPAVFDAYINEAGKQGMKVLLELNFGNPLYGGGAPETEEQLAAWGNYVRQVVSRYHGSVKHWEIWNEFDGGMGLRDDQKTWTQVEKAQHYVPILQTAYRIIKEIDPAATVIGCVTAGIRSEFIAAVFEAGGGDYLDAVSVHPYCYPNSPEAGDLLGKLDELRGLIASYGFNHPVWITEIGWPTHQGARGVSEQTQAVYLARTYALLLASGKVDAVFWYDLQNDGTDPYYNEDNFGIIRKDYSLKPAYGALAVICQGIGGFLQAEKLELGDELWCYRFNKGQDDVYALWTTGQETTVSLPINVPASRIELSGQASELMPTEGALRVTVGQSPIVIKKSVKPPSGDYQIRLLNKALRQGEKLRLAWQGKEASSMQAFIYNLAGAKVKEKAVGGIDSSGEIAIETDRLLPGAYLLQITFPADGERRQERLLFLVL